MRTELQHRTLGTSGLSITEIGFGLWAAGGDQWGTTDDGDVLAAIDYALDHGMDFFDTADVYGDGHSEEVLGRAMQGRREEFVVATKIGWRDFDDATGQSAYTTVEKVIAGVEGNLRRLNTDHIDLIQSHINFREPTMEVLVEGFQRLQRDGKVRAYGVSTSDFEYLKAFNADGGCASLQIDYSILNRTAEAEIFPYCQQNDIGIIVRGGLAMGILTGKFTPESRFPAGDFRSRWHENPDEYEVFCNDLAIVEQLRALATPDRSLAHLALQFTLHHPAVTSVIPGIKDVAQAQKNIAAGLLPPLTAQELGVIDALVAPGGGRKVWPA
jgi:aryl-alcohol dehydrogenase-like predicted oxidoreductase